MRTSVLLLLLVALLAACSSPRRRCCGPAATPDVQPPPAGPEVATEAGGASGRLYDDGGQALATVPGPAIHRADLVAFGELHGHPLGAEMELRLLRDMHARRGTRRIALAMEFLERDVQPAIDRYLAGEIDEATFMKEARQTRVYQTSHRPLIQFCKEQGIPVLAANSPRRLVRAWRKAETTDYAAWLDSLPEADRRLLPRTTSRPDDLYKQRFMKLMGARGENFFLSQALWDDAMGEAVADFRDRNPGYQVLLVVGGFHVQRGLGTITKFRDRRPTDRVTVIKMDAVKAEDLGFAESDRGEADLLYKVTMPPRPKSPHATRKPSKGAAQPARGNTTTTSAP